MRLVKANRDESGAIVSYTFEINDIDNIDCIIDADTEEVMYVSQSKQKALDDETAKIIERVKAGK